jgi:hypothetical protein
LLQKNVWSQSFDHGIYNDAACNRLPSVCKIYIIVSFSKHTRLLVIIVTVDSAGVDRRIGSYGLTATFKLIFAPKLNPKRLVPTILHVIHGTLFS